MEVSLTAAATEKIAARFAEPGRSLGRSHGREDSMIVLLIVGLIVGALWIIGFVRAVRNEPIQQRLRDYGTRR